MLRPFYVFLLLFVGCLSQHPVVAQSTGISEAWQVKPGESNHFREFDFWIGKWDVNLRMIQPDHSWKDSVQAKVEIYPILNGKAILELWDSSSIKGFSLRYYDPNKDTWVLYLNWPSNGQSSSIGSLQGQFRHGRGEFFAESGKRISRYTFCDITPTSLRWDDAYSHDGGKTWTNNWIMEFSRTAKKPQWPNDQNAHTFHSGKRCSGAPFTKIDKWVGRWTGEIDLGEDVAGKIPAKMNAYRILDGCSVIRFLEYELNEKTVRDFGLITWNAAKQQFEELQLDNAPGTTANLLRGASNDQVWIELSTANKYQHRWKIAEEGHLSLQIIRPTSDGQTKERVSVTLARSPSE